MQGFQMNIETAEEFFRRCAERKAATEADRLAIMKELVDELRVVKLNESDLTKRFTR